MGAISEDKLNADFKSFQTLDLPYIQKAKEAVKQYQETGIIDNKLMRDIRIEAKNDNKNLKGDFVVSMLLEVSSYQKKKVYRGGGKRGRTMLLKVQQNKVFQDLSNGKSVEIIAKELNVSTGMIYRLIKNNPERMKSLEKSKG